MPDPTTPPAAGEGQQTAPTTPPAVDQAARRIAELETLVNQSQQATALLTEHVRRQGTQQVQPEPDPDMDSDPRGYVDAQMKKMQQTVQQTALAHADQLDALNFERVAQQHNVDADLKREADAVFNNWRQRGVVINGAPPSRQDALVHAAGQRALQRHNAEAVESARKAANVGGVAAGGGGASSRNTGGTKDPDEVPFEERIKGDYWSKRLDAEGGF